MERHLIRVPASSANLGPGFDVLGLALSLWLTVEVTLPQHSPDQPSATFQCAIACTGDGADKMSLMPEQNLITKVAMVVFRHYNIKQFPPSVELRVHNDIPLGRGLGSSGAAIVAGVMLANAIAKLRISKDRMMEFCLMAEPHPDNIGASLFGGFIGSFLGPIADQQNSSIAPTSSAATPHSDTLSSSALAAAAAASASAQNPDAHPEGNPPLRQTTNPRTTANYLRFPWSARIKTIVIIPDYEVNTESARDALAPSYARADLVFNLQRVALLTHLLGQSSPNAHMIHQAMQDRVHQQQRQGIVHGLGTLLKLSPSDMPGLLGLCLSGAGPSILALATHNFESIATRVIDVITRESQDVVGNNGPVSCRWELLEPALDGASCATTTS